MSVITEYIDTFGLVLFSHAKLVFNFKHVFVENHVSVDESETSQKATCVQVVTGNRTGKSDGTE